jgi:uncharacterized protein (TIGR02099 family)
MKKRPARAQPRHRSQWHRVLRPLLRVCWYAVAVAGALLAVVFVAARLLLPMVAEKKGDLEALIARETGYTVRIEQLEAHWDGLYPGLRMQGISVGAVDAARPAVQLAELRFSLQLLPLFIGRVDIHSALLRRPRLALERLADGRFRVFGFGAIEQTDPAQTDALTAWLFRQNRLAIEDGELQWSDQREPTRPLKFANVNLRLKNNGDRHQLGVAADFPDGMCTGCSIVADVTGNPLLGTAFAGEIYVRARDVDVARLPRVIREQLPESLRGTFSVELWSDWKESLPVTVTGDVAVDGLRVPVDGLRAPLSVKQAATRLRWQSAAEGFRIQFEDLRLALHGAPWSVGTLEFERHQHDASLRVGRIELADITAFVSSLQLAPGEGGLPYAEATALWTTLKPEGVIRDVRAQLSGALDAPDDITLTADVEGLALAAHEDFPGVRGVGGRLWLTPDEGTFKLDMRGGALALPRVFRAPLPVARATAELRWRHQVDQWIVTTDDLAIDNEDIQASGRMLFRLPDDAARSPFLALGMDIHGGDGANVARYYPARHLPPATLAWMESSFLGGTITGGTLTYEGNTRDFPFNTAPGKFEIRAKARNGIYNYLVGWEPVTDVTADVVVTNDRFLVTGRGRIGALRARDIVVAMTGDGTVRVSANITGPTGDTLRVLREVEVAPSEGEWKQWLPDALQASGDGVLGLTLAIPVAQGNTRVRGEYHFRGGALRLADSVLEAKGLSGSIGFNENGVREGRVRTQLLGDDTALAIDSPRADETIAVMRGRATVASLAPLAGARLAPQFSGAIPWEGRLRWRRGRPDISGEADLSALRVGLPAPLNRPDGFRSDKLQLRTEGSGARELALALEVGGLLQARLRFDRGESWRFGAGRVVFDDTAAVSPPPVTSPPASGLEVSARLEEFDLDRWLALVGGDGAALSPRLVRVGASARRFVYLARDFGAIDVDLARDQGNWVGGLSGAAAAGRLRFDRGANPRVTLDLAHLRLPSPRPSDSGAETDPRDLPALDLRVREFEVRGKALGALDFTARPQPDGWRIERMRLVRPETRLEASGEWRREYGESSSRFSAHIASDDVGRTLEAFGLADQIEGATAELKAELAWNGAPADIDYASLNGSLELNAAKGRFPQLDQGAARLFGILDFSAIGRYLALDFTPIFGKGFAFDHLGGRVVLERGNAFTDGFSIRGPSARMRFNGRVGLVNEDFNLTLDVYPSLSDSLTLGALAVGGPTAALWTFIAQKLLRKQIEEGTRVTYFIKGPWGKPEVTRKLVEAPAKQPHEIN